jgi:CDP-glucose 4,6-dehydratase
MENLGMKPALPDAAFWAGRRVLVTGHTGFKGAWLTHWLLRMGAQVSGLSLAPNTQPSLFDQLGLSSRCESHIADIRDASAVVEVFRSARPEVVFHLAAQALVRDGYRQPLDTFAANVMGTAHVLDAVRQQDSVRVVVAITTDKVYRNREWAWPYREDDTLGGHDPYSASKAACEAVIDCWRLSYLKAQGVALASARAGNVVGGGDWSADRLLPDLIRAWSAGQSVHIRRPQATRPWQHVVEPLGAYLHLAQRLWNDPGLADAYNFGPHAHDALTVKAVVEHARTRFPGGQVVFGDGSEGPHEAGRLTLDTSRAAQVLGIQPRWNAEQAIARAADWYIQAANGASASTLCDQDIDAWISPP